MNRGPRSTLVTAYKTHKIAAILKIEKSLDIRRFAIVPRTLIPNFMTQQTGTHVAEISNIQNKDSALLVQYR